MTSCRFTSAHVQNIPCPQWSWWEDGESLPLLHLLCFCPHSQLGQGCPEKGSSRQTYPPTCSGSQQRGPGEAFSVHRPPGGGSPSSQAGRMTYKEANEEKKGTNATTYRHEWSHSAPAAAAPAPTSRLLSASTASQGVSRIHPPPSPRLPLFCHTSSSRPSFIPPQSFPPFDPLADFFSVKCVLLFSFCCFFFTSSSLFPFS